MASYCHDKKLNPLHKTGMARLIEHAQELAGHQNKLTLQFEEVMDTLKEANYWAGPIPMNVVFGTDVEKGHPGTDLPGRPAGEKLQEFIDEGMLFIETEGKVVGQMNGLSVYALGITPSAGPAASPPPSPWGGRGVVTIDREAQLAGNIHNKGVMILAGFLKSRFAQDKPSPERLPLLRAELRHDRGRFRVHGRTGHACSPPWRRPPGPKTSP